MKKTFEIIRGSSFFRQLPDSACRQLAEMSSLRTVAKRDFLFFEGAEGTAVYLLAAGTVQLSKTSLEGKETVIKTVRPGELFAEVILFEANRYPVTAAACVESEVVELPRSAFLRLLDDPGFRNSFCALLMARQRYLADKVQQIGSMDAEDRFADFLRMHHNNRDFNTPLRLPKKDVAAAIGIRPETFSRLLNRLEKEGRLVRTGRDIQLTEAFRAAHRLAD